jgi:hypothetical protein
MLEPVTVTNLGKVKLTYPAMPDFLLEMDFNPLIEQFRLRGQFCILHWQAKPKIERRWGVYDGGVDNYTSLKYNQLQVQVVPQLLQVDENVIKTVPTAVLVFPNSKLIKTGYYSISQV